MLVDEELEIALLTDAAADSDFRQREVGEAQKVSDQALAIGGSKLFAGLASETTYESA